MKKKHHSKHKQRKSRSVYLDADFEAINEVALINGAYMKIDFPEKLKGKQPAMGYNNTYKNNTNQHGWQEGYSGSESHHHPGDVVIFAWQGKQLYASNSHSLKEYSGKWDLIIDLASIINKWDKKEFIRHGDRFKSLNQYTTEEDKKIPSEVLKLDWPDMGIAPASIMFWQELWKLLPEKTVIACFGGHGRTGSCLVALMIAAGESYYTALTRVRKEHCIKAVETRSQEKYLHKLYMARISQEMIEAEGNFERQINLQTQLQYAIDNPPTLANTEAVRSSWEKPKAGTVAESVKSTKETEAAILDSKSKAKTMTFKNGSTHWTGEDGTPYREDKDGSIWAEECIKATCAKSFCYNQSHLGWVQVLGPFS